MGKEWVFSELGVVVRKQEERVLAEITMHDDGISEFMYIVKEVIVDVNTPTGTWKYSRIAQEYITPSKSEEEIEKRVKSVIEKSDDKILSDILKTLKVFNDVIGGIRRIYGKDVKVKFTAGDC